MGEWRLVSRRREDPSTQLQRQRAPRDEVAGDRQRQPGREHRSPTARRKPPPLGRDDVEPSPRVSEDLVDAGWAEEQVERPSEDGGDFGGGWLRRVPLLVDVCPVSSA